MTDQELQNADNVVLYAKPTLVIDAQLGQIDGSAFTWNGRGDGLSVNWLECFGNLPKAQQLDTIRRLIRLNMRPSGRLAELNVGVVIQNIAAELESPRFVRRPLAETAEFEADPSYCELAGLPSLEEDEVKAAEIGEIIANCIASVHSVHEELQELD